MRILVLNSGSSSLKYELFATSGDDVVSLTEGLSEGLGETGERDQVALVSSVLARVERIGEPEHGRIAAMGHRVVHGGNRFSGPTLIDAQILEQIRSLIPLAPLHNPAAIAGIEAIRSLRPEIPQVAVFDTAFHHTIPPQAWRYALPRWCYETYGIRRYGMHGTSYSYVTRRAAAIVGRPVEEVNLIALHLGNGASVAAIEGGVCVDTSMGFTPLEGLVMGTRCGDLDPSVPLRLCRDAGLAPDEVDRILNCESGLRGLCGDSDMRKILQRAATGDAEAELALAAYCHRARKYVGAYAASLGRLDAVVFTAGVGENAPEVRRRICDGLQILGLELDGEKNRLAPHGEEIDIAASASRVRTLVIPTDEEFEIAVQTLRIVCDDAAHRSLTI